MIVRVMDRINSEEGKHMLIYGNRSKGKSGLLPYLATWGLAAMLGLLWIGLSMAWVAAGRQWWQTGEKWNGWDATGVVLALVWSAVVAFALDWVDRRWGNRMFVAVATILGLLVGTGWVLATKAMLVWPMDGGMFRWFLDRLANGGYSEENLRQMTWMYDYALWTHRALPLLYPLRIWCGPECFRWVVQLLQGVLGSVTLAAIWRMVAMLWGSKAAKWAVVAILSMPAFGMQSVGLNHQVWGMCWFVLGVWLWVEWFHDETDGWKRWVKYGGLAIPLGVLLKWEGFVWPGYLACGLLIATGEAIWMENARKSLTGIFVLLVIPLAVVAVLSASIEQKIESANPQSINAGQMSFIARGWDFQAWGEYAERVEQLDVSTPSNEKSRFFMQYLATQAAYNGTTLVGKLFPSKLAKYMLAGYASMAEEILLANGAERTSRVVRGMRVGWFVLLYAPLMLWGLWHLSNQLEYGRPACLLIPVALFGVAVMFVGETSPRYAISIQPLLLAAGVCGWVQEQKKRERVADIPILKHPFAMGIALVMGGYGVFAGGILGGQEIWKRYALADMREALLEGGHPSEEAFQAPFEAVFPAGEGGVTWTGRGGGAVVYLRGRSWREKGAVEISTREGEWQKMDLPIRVEVKWEEDAARRLTVRRTGDGGEVWMGYADVRDAMEP